MHQVVCFGEILWDNFPDQKKAGGAPMNVAIHLCKQGIDSRLISSVGKDDDGRELVKYLSTNQLDVSLVQTHPELPTGTVKVELDVTGQASYTILAPVAWDEIYYHPFLQQIIQNADALLFGTLACRNEVSESTLLKLLPSARFKVFDMNLRAPHFNSELLKKLLRFCDLLKINEDELNYLSNLYSLNSNSTEKQVSDLNKLIGVSTICLTLGADGAMVLHNGELHQHQGYPVEVADTVGAGDAFLATFLSSFLHKYHVKDALSRACAAGAFVASRAGANPEYGLSDILAICEA